MTCPVLLRTIITCICVLIVSGCGDGPDEPEPGPSKADIKQGISRNDAGIPAKIQGEPVSGYCQAALEVSRSQPDPNQNEPTKAYVEAVKRARDESPDFAKSYWSVTYEVVQAAARNEQIEQERVLASLKELDRVAADVETRCADALQALD